MLTWEELKKLREDFETAYARHAKRYVGLAGTVEEIAELVKKDRNGPHYRNEKCDYAWIGYQLAPIPKSLSTPEFLADLDRAQLHRCVEMANERLEKLEQVAKVQVWLLIVDGVRRYTATSSAEAMSWLGRFVAAYEAAPDPDLLDSERRPVLIETGKVHADELPVMLSVNDKPEAFAKW
ncbi:hypothetical protein COAQ111491_22045 [Comamonas aquatilis]|uniref:hypothetical protein n=1 Tax=Comamonas aquatilis TaxID=1778406 RepID=UPI0039F14E5F